MILWKCCTLYASKFEKLSSGHRTGKGQFSSQSQRKTMPKKAQITTQLHLSHTLAKWCSKFSILGFNSIWTVNFQMFKLDLEKEEELEITCQHLLDHQKSKTIPEKKKSTSALLTMTKPLTVWIITTVKNSSRDGDTRPPDLPPEKYLCRSGSNS